VIITESFWKMPEPSDEKIWIRDRIGRLRELLKFVIDARATAAIQTLIGEAEARLKKLGGCKS